MAAAPAYRPHPFLATGALALAGCFWGTGFFFGKIALTEMSVLQNVTWRFLFGSVCLIPVMFRTSRGFSRRDLRLILLASIIGVPVQFLIQFKGLELTTVSHASLMVGTIPMLLAVTSVIFLNERLTAREWAVLFASAAGAMLIALSSRDTGSASHPSLRGDLLVLLSMIAAVAMMLISKRLMERYPPLQVTSTLILLGTLSMLMYTAIFGRGFPLHFSLKIWFAVAAQGVLATALAYLLWNWGLARVPASRSSVFLNLEPVVGALLGITILGESLGTLAIVGGAMILGSAVYFSRKTALA